MLYFLLASESHHSLAAFSVVGRPTTAGLWPLCSRGQVHQRDSANDRHEASGWTRSERRGRPSEWKTTTTTTKGEEEKEEVRAWNLNGCLEGNQFGLAPAFGQALTIVLGPAGSLLLTSDDDVVYYFSVCWRASAGPSARPPSQPVSWPAAAAASRKTGKGSRLVN